MCTPLFDTKHTNTHTHTHVILTHCFCRWFSGDGFSTGGGEAGLRCALAQRAACWTVAPTHCTHVDMVDAVSGGEGLTSFCKLC